MAADSRYRSWGLPEVGDTRAVRLRSRHDPLPDLDDELLLPFGNGRSYGDSCLNPGGAVLDTAALDHFIRFDDDAGILRCESGVLLDDLQRLIVPRGWMLPVTPGTRFVTLGGAVANDVHGKNHHRAGTFGCHVRELELLRSDGSRLQCSPERNRELFAATIGGLGLTGLITWVEIELKPVVNPYLQEETLRFGSVNDFFSISDSSDQIYEYTVAWIDCLARGDALGRGGFFRANHHGSVAPQQRPRGQGRTTGLPFTPPVSLINGLSLRAFNTLYYHRLPKRRNRTVHYQKFFYPLDSIANWNRMYGPRGMLQYQCVLPGDDGRTAVREMLQEISVSKRGSFLAVLKVFGDVQSPGMMSFPAPGVTLALDFPNDTGTRELLDRLDVITLAAGGRVYPAKDARMGAQTFAAGFPQWEAFSEYVDPAFSSGFWRRVTGAEEE